MTQDLKPGFADVAVDAARSFRLVLDAMAHPGRMVALEGPVPPAPCSRAAGTALLTLVDATTPLHLAGAHDCAAMRAWVAFHLGAPLVAPDKAVFALGTWDALGPLGAYAQGTPEYPDRAATLIVEMAELTQSGTRLWGPGIESEAYLSVPDRDALRWNAARFPLGLDFLFTCGADLAALPRSTQLGGA
jgi:alpha-D-ribose 1-methylphosphonate 5-triphosphate synthase subunit PhnH